jgi:acyl-CoA synthetase (AMP-forming)/AMP-acid ligase II
MSEVVSEFSCGIASSALTVDAVLRQRVAMHPMQTALVQDGRSLTYAGLLERVDRLAQALRRTGARPGDRIAILSENRMEYVESILACAVLGTIAACKNWRQSDEELAYCFDLTKPTSVLVSPRYIDRLSALPRMPERVLAFGPAYEQALEESTPPAEIVGISKPEDGLVIMYTSGTTGHPKAAVVSHRAEIARALIGVADGQLHPGRGTICWSPLYHNAASDHMFGILMQGDTVFLTDGFKPEEMLEIMSRELLGTVSIMPAAVGRMIETVRRTGLRPKGIKACGSMADLLPRHQIAELSMLMNSEFRNTFGSTETGQPPASRGRFAIGAVPQRLSKVQSSYCELRLVDENDDEVAAGMPGEVAIRGPSLFSGYWAAPEVNAREFRGGWFHTGDVMVRNADGTLDFVDRRKYLIKSGGENIYPAEIERILLANRAIGDVAVVRKPDAHWGEVPVAFVVAEDPALRAEDVIAMCRGRIAPYKLPKQVHFIADSDMPRSETGKIKRFELEKLLADFPPKAGEPGKGGLGPGGNNA